MACGTKYLMFLTLILLLSFESTFVTLSRSKSIVKTLPGYPGELPVKLETGYVGIGEKEEVQLFYYFCESERNLDEDPLILYLTGGPGTSAMLSLFCQIGPLSFIFDNSLENLRITLNPNSWTKMANMLFVDMSAGVGFSYATTKEAWISSDSILVKQTHDFLRKFLIDHPKFLKNPLYISGTSYMGIVVPIVTLELYNANGRGYQPTLNIQGYILCGPLTDKFIDPNSRVEYSHRTSLISDDIYKSAILNCHGDYINTNTANSACISILQRYEECTSKVNRLHILEPVCQLSTRKMHCDDHDGVIADWANDETVQQVLNIRQGTIEKWEMDNKTMAYETGKNDTFCYTYDIFSSVVYHKKLFQKSCRALIFSGDHDMAIPYVGIEQWISSLNLIVESPWEPFYVNNQVGGYKMTYARNDYSLTFATVKGSGHSVPQYKPEEALNLVSRWLQKIT